MFRIYLWIFPFRINDATLGFQERLMTTSIDEAKLKDLLKSALAEVLEERREFVKEIIEEAMEDIALARAINEGVGTDTVSRQGVFTILETAQ
jgi:hypothetical protein